MSDEYASGTGAYDDARHTPYGERYQSGDGTTGGGMDEQPDDRFAPGHGVWQPLTANGEFDAEATMNTPFTGRLPGVDALFAGGEPLAAPGHGYVPDPHGYPAESHGTGQPAYDFAPQPDPGQGWPPPEPASFGVQDASSGEQWTVPFAPEDPAEASGEYSVGQIVAPSPPETPSEQAPPAPDGGADPATGFDAPRTPDPLTDPLTDPLPGPADPPVDAEPPPDDDTPPDAEAPGDGTSPHSEHPTSSYTLNVNGADRPVTQAWLGESLLYVLRERLGLAGAKDGCEQGECGACSVQVDGRLVASCLVPAATAAGCEVRTVEGLDTDGRPSDVQRALADCGAVQCGFCVPGLAMTVHDLLEGNHRPTELETRQALSGNLCRCSGYQGVLDAVREVVAAREAAHETAHDGEQTGHEAPRIPHQPTGDPDGATS